VTWHYTNLAFSLEREEDFSAASCLGGRPSVRLSASPTASRYSSNDSEMDCSNPSPSGMTCEHSTGDHGVDSYIMELSAQGSHVSPSVLEESRRQPTMNATCGLTRLGFFPNATLGGSCLRTFQASWVLGRDQDGNPILEPFWETFPRWGMIVAGVAYRLNQAERHTEETDSGLWPTPNTTPERPCEGNVRMLRQKVLAGDMTETEARSMLNGKSPFEAQGAIPALDRASWPTPYASDVRTYRLSAPGSQSHDRSLCSIMRREENGHLSPDWTEWLMGWPMGWSNTEAMDGLGSWWRKTWWADEPVPRITTTKTNRTKRLKAIGNGQVPACVVKAWHALSSHFTQQGVQT